jgi:hypothetical protein
VPPVPGDTVSARLSRVLEAGGIESTPERVQRLAYLMQWSIDQIIQRSRPRPGDSPKIEPIKRRGRPPSPDMRALFVNLAWFWFDESEPHGRGVLPAWTYNDYTDKYSGRFVDFARALSAELALDAEALAGVPQVSVAGVRAFAGLLDGVARRPARVRTWLRVAGGVRDLNEKLEKRFAPDE